MKNGDVVQLKSGGPRMTVIDIFNNLITVTWFDDSNNIKVTKFPIESLQIKSIK